MTLILCPECKQQISDKAYMCPHCGIEIEDLVGGHEVELTNKRYKIAFLWSLLCFFLAVITLGYEVPSVIPSVFGFLGVTLLIYAKFGAWWNNG